MARPHFLLLLLSIFLLPACSPKTQPAQIFPGFEKFPPDSLATIREAESVYISSIDTRNAPELDNNMMRGLESYRQFQIPAGINLIAFYYHSSNMESHSYNTFVRVQAGHTYSFASKLDEFVNYNKRQWHTQLIDDATGQPAATGPFTRPATRPTTSP
jgi:hypothetical protein